jgi:hypothetical protein
MLFKQLLRNQLEQERVIESRFGTLPFEGQFGWVTLEKVEGNMAQDGEVFGAVPGSEAGVVFPKRDIQRPMEGIFNGPVGARGVQQELGIRWQTGNEIRRFGLDVSPRVAFTLDHDN